jgi:nucleotide-binding universal stress UspA family protein
MTNQQSRVIVVGVDFGSSGDHAIMEGLRWLDSGMVSTLHAVHVLDPRDVIDDPEFPALQTEDEFVERAPTILLQRIGRFANEAGRIIDVDKVRTHARIGKAATAIHQVAVDYDADLIIVGTHGRRGIDRLVLGSVAETLVRTAHCPVFVAKPKDYSGLDRSARPEEPYGPGEAPAYHDLGRDVKQHISSQDVTWTSNERPTGFRIV